MIPADARPVMDGHFHVTADGDVYGPRGRKLRTYVHPNGYASVNRRFSEGTRRVYVHRLVAEAFHGTPSPGAVTRHLNGDRSDNRAVNLVWGTHEENAADRDAHGRTSRGERHGRARLTWDQVEAIRSEYAAGGVSQRALARTYGVSRYAINDIFRGRTWKEARP